MARAKLYSAASGMTAQQTSMDVVANNLANATTTGYKRDRMDLVDLAYQPFRLPTGKDGQVGLGAAPGAIGKEHEQGALQNTGRALDVAIQGEGFLQVTRPDGTLADWVAAARTRSPWTPLMADVDSVEAAEHAAALGFDTISTTLYGYTAATKGDGNGDHARAGGSYLTGVHVKKSETNVESGMSMDQIVADALKNETQLSSLQLTLDANTMVGSCDGGYSCAYSNTLSWLTPTLPLMSENDPRVVFIAAAASSTVLAYLLQAGSCAVVRPSSVFNVASRAGSNPAGPAPPCIPPCIMPGPIPGPIP